MKNKTKIVTAASTSSSTAAPGKTIPNKPAQDEARAADDAVHKTDRPGFDLGGSSGETHAGTGLGLGVDAFDNAGDRRLPGRRLDNKLTIPRWGGAEPEAKTEPVEKTTGPESHSAPKAKTTR
jgi:hypothetical protein